MGYTMPSYNNPPETETPRAQALRDAVLAALAPEALKAYWESCPADVDLGHAAHACDCPLAQVIKRRVRGASIVEVGIDEIDVLSIAQNGDWVAQVIIKNDAFRTSFVNYVDANHEDEAVLMREDVLAALDAARQIAETCF